jgi:response regulator RpfG family c-di-GMP phosphodiesterase
LISNEFIPIRTVELAFTTILVVANDPKFLKFLETALKLEFECEVLPFTRGKSAVEMSEHVKTDLFIIDCHLLDCNALELSRQLHSIKKLVSVPTVLLNSPVTPSSEHEEYDTIFLSMSFALGDLYTAVKKSLFGHMVC